MGVDFGAVGDQVHDLVVQALQIAVGERTVLPVGIPVRDLDADEHAGDDDDEVDRDGSPFLLAEMGNDATENHGAAHCSRDSARWSASLRNAFISFKCRLV